MTHVACFFCLFFIITKTYCEWDMENIMSALRSLASKENDYHPTWPPVIQFREPTLVKAQLFVENLIEISKEAKMIVYLRQQWHDPRLKTNISLDEGNIFGKFDIQFKKRIWNPDTLFVYVSDTDYVGKWDAVSGDFIWISNWGIVRTSSKIVLRTMCDKNLKFYPFDTLSCKIKLASYGYTDDVIQYGWLHENNERNIKIDKESVKRAGEFIVVDIKTYLSPQQFDTGNFSGIEGRIVFKRQYSGFIIQAYLPAALIVMLSWMGFWIDRSDTSSRASISVTTVLTLLTLATNNRQSGGTTLTAIDIYLWTCFGYVIAAMIECGWVDYLKHNSDQKMEKMNDRASDTYVLPSPESTRPRKMITLSDFVVDIISRCLFPITFILFNAIYVLILWRLLEEKGNEV